MEAGRGPRRHRAEALLRPLKQGSGTTAQDHQSEQAFTPAPCRLDRLPGRSADAEGERRPLVWFMTPRARAGAVPASRGMRT